MVTISVTNVNVTKIDTNYKIDFDVGGQTYSIKVSTAPTDTDVANEIKAFLKTSKVGYDEAYTITKTSYSFNTATDIIS